MLPRRGAGLSSALPAASPRWQSKQAGKMQSARLFRLEMRPARGPTCPGLGAESAWPLGSVRSSAPISRAAAGCLAVHEEGGLSAPRGGGREAAPSHARSTKPCRRQWSVLGVPHCCFTAVPGCRQAQRAAHPSGADGSSINLPLGSVQSPLPGVHAQRCPLPLSPSHSCICSQPLA